MARGGWTQREAPQNFNSGEKPSLKALKRGQYDRQNNNGARGPQSGMPRAYPEPSYTSSDVAYNQGRQLDADAWTRRSRHHRAWSRS